MRLEDIIFVLARPSEPGNTGAVCRAMKNMGFRRLRIVAQEMSPVPQEDPHLTAHPAELKKLLDRAIHATDVWEEAVFFADLPAALADCAISVGTSRRRGRHRKSRTLTPRELTDFLKDKPGKAAIVFGNERTGLTTEELELCNTASHIPVSPEFPSINLSHAVQIYAYELYQALGGRVYPNGGMGEGPDPISGKWVPMNAVQIDALVKDISNSLAAIGFYKNPGREEQERFLRDLIARAGLSLSEGRYLGKVIVKAERLGEINN